MKDSVYKVIELVGTSDVSWEEAAKHAIEQAGHSLHDLRIAEVKALDLRVEGNQVIAYRVKLDVSFKLETLV